MTVKALYDAMMEKNMKKQILQEQDFYGFRPETYLYMVYGPMRKAQLAFIMKYACMSH